MPEDWFERGKYDELIDELKDSLRKEVKEEIKRKIENLEKEVESLKSYRDDREKHQKEIFEIKEECKQRIQDAESKSFTKFWQEILTPAWRVKGRYADYGPKCNLCDERRMRHFKSPLGRNMSEDCTCASRPFIYSPEKIKCGKITVKGKTPNYYRNEGDHTLYYAYESTWDDREEYIKLDEGFIYKPGMDFKEADKKYQLLFLNEEDCQKFCDWKNNKNKNLI